MADEIKDKGDTTLAVARLSLVGAVSVAVISGILSIVGTLLTQRSFKSSGTEIYCRISEQDLRGSIAMVTDIMKKGAVYRTEFSRSLINEVKFSTQIGKEPDLKSVIAGVEDEYKSYGEAYNDLAHKLKTLMDLCPRDGESK